MAKLKLHAADWVIVNVALPTLIVPLRWAVLAAATYPTVPSPVPAPPTTVIQGALAVAVQVQFEIT
jgi:hypothetical protein